MAKIALVDDDKNVLASLSMMLETEGFEVECHSDAQTALDAFTRRVPDLAVIDVAMPRMDGMELLRRVREKGALPVILMTARGDEVDEVLGLRMGADDYLRKPFSRRILVERMRTVLRRVRPARHGMRTRDDDEVVVRGDLSVDPLRHQVKWKGQPVSLTATEFLLLQALAHRPGIVKSRDQLMDAAYEDHVYVDDRTVDSHIKRLRRKFRRIDPAFSAIQTLYGIGYRFGQE